MEILGVPSDDYLVVNIIKNFNRIVQEKNYFLTLIIFQN